MADDAESCLDCPHCGREVQSPPGDWSGTILCPHCGGPILLGDLAPAPPSDAFSIVDDTSEQEAHRQRRDEEELSGQRIKQIAMRRRATIRSRSYSLIAAVGGLVGAAQLGWMMIQAVREQDVGRTAVGYGLFALLLLWVARYFLGRAAAYQQEIRASLLDEPAAPPDFTPLSDGSQRWRNLDRME